MPSLFTGLLVTATAWSGWATAMLFGILGGLALNYFTVVKPGRKVVRNAIELVFEEVIYNLRLMIQAQKLMPSRPPSEAVAFELKDHYLRQYSPHFFLTLDRQTRVHLEYTYLVTSLYRNDRIDMRDPDIVFSLYDSLKVLFNHCTKLKLETSAEFGMLLNEYRTDIVGAPAIPLSPFFPNFPAQDAGFSLADDD